MITNEDNLPAMRRLITMFTLLALALFSLPRPASGQATPDGQPAPRVVGSTPAAYEEINPDTILQITFDQPMNRESVAAALSIVSAPATNLPATPIKPAITWKDDQTLSVFAPDFKRGEQYILKIGVGAKSQTGVALAETYQLGFNVAGALKVSQVIPAPDSRDVQAASTITVIFNRPVVPLVDTSNQAGLPQPLTLIPAVTGQGEWVSTSIYVFRPTEPLAGGTTFTAAIDPALKDTTGGALGTAYSWKFTTAAPQLISITPQNGSLQVPLDSTVTLRFNQPMDITSVEKSFSVLDKTGAKVAGSFAWSDRDTIMVFKPGVRFELGGLYRVSITGEATSKSGTARLTNPLSTTFNTLPYPALVNSNPANGSTDAYPGSGLQLNFNTLMDQKSFADRIKIEPKPETFSVYVYGQGATISFASKPVTEYTVTIEAGIADIYGNQIKTPIVIRFKTRAMEPSLYVPNKDAINLTNAYLPDTTLYAVSNNVSQVDVTLSRLELADIYALRNTQISFERLPVVRQFTVKPQGQANQQTISKLQLAGDNGGVLKPGLYAVEVSAPELRSRQNYQPQRVILVVGTANLTMKRDPKTFTVWATDLKSGLPIPNAPIEVFDQFRQSLGKGITDASGLVTIPVTNGLDRYDSVAVLKTDSAYGLSAGYGGIQLYDFGVTESRVQSQVVAYLYTDQAIYRPARPIYFKGILRYQEDVTYTLPTGKVKVTLNSPEGKQLYQKELPLSEFGTFSGQYDLPQDARLGQYYWSIEYNGTQYGGGALQVAEFRLPEFQVAAKPTAKEVVRDATIKVEVDSTFFFGGPVSNARVQWNALSNPTSFTYTGEGEYTFGVGSPWYWYDFYYYRNRGNGGQSISSGTGITDANGKFTIELPATLADPKKPYEFTVEATVTDITNQAISGRTTVTVHPSEVYVGLRSDTTLAKANSPVKIDLIAVDWASKPLANQTVKTSVIIKRYEQDPKTFENKEITDEISAVEVRTDDKGRASFSFTPKTAGLFQVFARALDKAERLAESATYVWVSGPQPFADNSGDKALRMVADKRAYKPDDVAEILIPSPFKGKSAALLTVERAGIIKSEVITVEGGTSYKLPITEQYAPDAYVSVTLIKGMDGATDNPDYRAGVLKLVVEVKQQVTVKLTPNVARAKPGDVVSFDVLTTDRTGEPIAASVGLKLTDKAAISVAGENGQNIFDAFWYERGLSVVTIISLQDLIDTIRPTEANMKDLQQPGGGGGGSANEFGAAADGMLAGAAPAAPSSAAQPTQNAARAKSDDKNAQQPATRLNFVDTPLWVPEAVTGADGKTTVKVTLPDNLTTWQLEGRAISKATYAGQSTTEIVSTLPLLVRPTTPRFFVVGDEAELAAVVNNNTESDLSVQVKLDVTGATLKDGQSTATVTIPKAGRARVNWRVVVGNVSAVDVTFTAISGEYGDAAKPDVGLGDKKLLPVYQYVSPDYVATAGVLRGAGSRTELVQLPTGASAAVSGDLTVRLNTSLAAVTLDGLTYLRNFEYQCTEQTISKFLPNVITYRALQKLGQDSPELKANLLQAIQEALVRLKSGQKQDGGFGWYPRDESNPQVTAYAVLGLLEARGSDLLTDKDMLDRAIRFLLGKRSNVDMNTSYWELNTRAFVEYVLARTGNPDRVKLDNLFTQRDRMSLFAKAYIAQAYDLAQGDRSRIDALLSDLVNGAVLSGTGAHFEETRRDWWNWDSNTRTTAIILGTLVKLTPQSDLIPNIVRWLVVARKDRAWETTQETAWAIMSLTDFMVASNELKGNYPYTVNLNGKELTKGQAAPANLKVTQALATDVLTLLKDQANKISVNRGDGEGTLYYTATLHVDQPVEAIKPTARGLDFKRTYYVAGKAVTEAKVGDLITVSLDLFIPHDLHYVVVNDPIPAGTEMVDTSLQTTSQIGQPPQLDKVDARYGWGWWWWSDTQLKTEKAVLTARYLPSGTYKYVYQIRASSPGVYRVIPPNGNEFYFPEVFGRGAGSLFTVKAE